MAEHKSRWILHNHSQILQLTRSHSNKQTNKKPRFTSKKEILLGQKHGHNISPNLITK